MINWYYFVSAFSILWSTRMSDILRPGAWKEGLGKLFFECMELYFQAAFLVGIYSFVWKMLPGINAGSFFPLFFALGAYLVQMVRRKDDFFFFMVFALGIFHVSPLSADLRITDPFLSLAAMVTLIFLYTGLLLGLKKRLLLSRVPKQLQGLPIDLFTASLVAFGLWAFQGIIP